MINFAAIEALIPNDGFLTVSFTRKAPGVLRVICVPTYMGLDEKNSKVVNVPKPVMVTVSDPLPATARIKEIAEEARARYNDVTAYSKPKAGVKGGARVEQLLEARKKLDEELAALGGVDSTIVQASPTLPLATGKSKEGGRKGKGKEISLSSDEIANIPRLPEKYGSILRLRVVEKKSVADVAEELGISRQSVYLRQDAALTRLKQLNK